LHEPASGTGLPYGAVARYLMQNSLADSIGSNHGTNYGLSFMTLPGGGFFGYGYSNSAGVILQQFQTQYSTQPAILQFPRGSPLLYMKVREQLLPK
jgi:hypothetical protein